MTQTEILERLAAIDAEFYGRYDNPVTDGIVDAELYFDSYPKIMWILKEANDNNEESGSWDMKSAIKSLKTPHGVRKGWAATFHKIIYTMYGILNDESYEDMQFIQHNPEMIDALNHIAFINIKKTPGAASANGNLLTHFYAKDKDLILEQINLSNPDVIICAGTFDYIKADLNELSALGDKTEMGIIHHYTTSTRLVIDAYHPNARSKGVTNENYSDSIIEVVKSWAEVNKQK